MRSGIYVFEIVTIYISSHQVGKVSRSLLALLVRIGHGREFSFLTILLYFEFSKNTYFLFKYTEDIYGYICACCGEEESPYAGKAKEYVSWIECDLALKMKMFQMQTGFAHITAKSWMM